MNGPKGKKTRLESWKEVAAFFGRTERTVMRWESERGLPIHRLPGDLRSRISADVDELEAWLRSADGPDHETAASPAHQVEMPVAAIAEPQANVRRTSSYILPSLVAATILTGAALFWGTGQFRSTPHAAPPEAQALYVRGMADWGARTPVSLTRAVDEFNAAIHIDPGYAEAYVGLANCYNLLSEYTAMPSSQAFPLAAAAAEHAIRIDDRLGSAHAALAFSLFYGSWQAQRAGKEYDRALQLEPNNANTQHWYATFLYTQTDFQGGLNHIDRALELDPSSISIQADRAIIMYRAGQAADAVTILKQMAKDHPAFRSPHSYLAQIYFLEGKDEDFLREAMVTAQLANDLYGESAARAAREGFDKNGHEGMLRALLDVLQKQYSHGIGSAFNLAGISAQLHDNDGAMAYLKLAFDRHDPDIIYTRLDPRLAPLHPLKAYQDLVAKIQT